ncbi:MAG TPA: helix-turn-helix domain-containing protein, partial [Candidatus Polarisedimenticolaceae bacterium]|nr:helix-turn-helix domain-containing protein [Candidatus Polarisedimenticolaceae bacterium]
MSQPASASFGDKLRQAREGRNVTVEQLGAETGIDLRYLQAIERDDLSALPGRAFGKFFIRVYAEALEFDPQPLLEEYDRDHGPAAEPSEARAGGGELR